LRVKGESRREGTRGRERGNSAVLSQDHSGPDMLAPGGWYGVQSLIVSDSPVRSFYFYSMVWNSILRVSVTLLEASRISNDTRFPASS